MAVLFPSFADKDSLESLTSRLETATYVLTLLVGIVGVSFLFVNRRLQKVIKADTQEVQRASDERIAAANALAAAAKASAETASAEGERFKTERVQLELRLKEMEKAHSQSEQKVAKLEEAALPRSITPLQQQQISALLLPLKGHSVEIRLYSQENEAVEFATQILQTLKLAGISTQFSTVVGTSGNGLGIGISGTTAPDAANAIMYAFRSAGIGMGIVNLPNIPADSFVVFVGAKMPPPQ